jgi:hypothetical protein
VNPLDPSSFATPPAEPAAAPAASAEPALPPGTQAALDALNSGDHDEFTRRAQAAFDTNRAAYSDFTSQVKPALDAQGLSLVRGPGGDVSLEQKSPSTLPAAQRVTAPEVSTPAQASAAEPASQATEHPASEPAPEAATPAEPSAEPAAHEPFVPTPEQPYEHNVAGYPLDDAQQALVHQGITDTVPLSTDEQGKNPASWQTFDDGTKGISKPEELANRADPDASRNPDGTPAYGPLYVNDLAAYNTDRAFGFGLVPTTAPFDAGPAGGGIGSIQAQVPGIGTDTSNYSLEDQQRMGVLDYVMGNADRHLDNWRTTDDGRPGAIDNSYSFPQSTNDAQLRSDFVFNTVNQPISDEVMNQVNSVDPEDLRQSLLSAGLHPDAAQGAVDRLTEIQTNRTITLENWKGSMMSSDFSRIASSPSDPWRDTNMQQQRRP